MQSLGYLYVSDEWRLFIDASKTSLESVSLHNGNTKPSVPLAHAVNMKESYESMKTFRSSWILEVSLKYLLRFRGNFLIAWLTAGLHKAYVFLCKYWYLCEEEIFVELCAFVFGVVVTALITIPKLFGLHEKNFGRNVVMHTPLIDQEKVYLPTLHIKLGTYEKIF